MSSYGIGDILASALLNQHSATWSSCLNYGACPNTNITYRYDRTQGTPTFMPSDERAFRSISASSDIASIESRMCTALGSAACGAEPAVVNLCWEAFWLYSGLYGETAVTAWNKAFGLNDACITSASSTTGASSTVKVTVGPTNILATTATRSEFSTASTTALGTDRTASTTFTTVVPATILTRITTVSSEKTYTLTNEITTSRTVTQTIAQVATNSAESFSSPASEITLTASRPSLVSSSAYGSRKGPGSATVIASATRTATRDVTTTTKTASVGRATESVSGTLTDAATTRPANIVTHNASTTNTQSETTVDATSSRTKSTTNTSSNRSPTPNTRLSTSSATSTTLSSVTTPRSSSSSGTSAPVRSAAASTSTGDPYAMDGTPFIWNWPSSSSHTRPSNALLTAAVILSMVMLRLGYG